MGKYRHRFVIEQPGQQARQKRRLKLFLPATVEHADQDSRAHLLDLSKLGARLHINCPPVKGDQITIRAMSIEIAATVVWVRGNGAGVLFANPLTEPQISLLIEA